MTPLSMASLRRARSAGSPAGDPEAFAAAYERHHQELSRYCRSILRNEEDAQDALQNTMVKAFAALQTETREIALRPWLFRIAHNESISVLRRRQDTTELDDRVGGSDDTLQRTVETRERLRHLSDDLQDLPERQRSALVMRELSGLGHEEIAVALGSSARAVKQTIYEARCSLGDCAEGRSMDCDAVRRTLSDDDGRIVRSRQIRAHLRSCRSCRAFGAALRQRPKDLAALSPALPLIGAGGLLAAVQGATVGGTAGGGAAGTAGLSAALGTGSAVGGTAVAASAGGGLALTGLGKLAAVAAVTIAAGGGTVALERATDSPSPTTVSAAADGARATGPAPPPASASGGAIWPSKAAVASLAIVAPVGVNGTASPASDPPAGTRTENPRSRGGKAAQRPHDADSRQQATGGTKAKRAPKGSDASRTTRGSRASSSHGHAPASTAASPTSSRSGGRPSTGPASGVTAGASRRTTAPATASPPESRRSTAARQPSSPKDKRGPGAVAGAGAKPDTEQHAPAAEGPSTPPKANGGGKPTGG